MSHKRMGTFLCTFSLLVKLASFYNYRNNCWFKQSKMFSMLFSATNFDKFIRSIGPRDPPYSFGRQLGLTYRWKDSKELPWKWILKKGKKKQIKKCKFLWIFNYSISDLFGKKRPHYLGHKLSDKVLVENVNFVKTDRKSVLKW